MRPPGRCYGGLHQRRRRLPTSSKEQEFTSPVMRELERVVLLRVVDEYWMDHIDAMADLRQGIRLRAYAQTDPVDRL